MVNIKRAAGSARVSCWVTPTQFRLVRLPLSFGSVPESAPREDLSAEAGYAAAGPHLLNGRSKYDMSRNQTKVVEG